MEINKFDMFKNGYYVFTIEEYDNIQNKYETEIENLKRKLGYERLRQRTIPRSSGSDSM